MNKHYIRDEYPPQSREPSTLARYGIALIAAVLAVVAALHDARAQTVPGNVTFTWVLPTTTTTNLPLTGVNALTEVQAFIDTAPIDPANTVPTAVLLATATTATRTITVPNGATIYGRFKACNKSATGAQQCSGMSMQAFKVVQADTTPGVPTNVTIELKIG